MQLFFSFGISQAHGFESLLEAEDSPSLGAEATVGRVTLWQDAFNEWMLSACEKYGKALAQSSPVLSCSCMPGPSIARSPQGIHKKVHGKAKTLGRVVSPDVTGVGAVRFCVRFSEAYALVWQAYRKKLEKDPRPAQLLSDCQTLSGFTQCSVIKDESRTDDIDKAWQEKGSRILESRAGLRRGTIGCCCQDDHVLLATYVSPE